MAGITAIFWDVGGVLLTNAWDHRERQGVLQQFSIAEEDFNRRHEQRVAPFERGEISLDEYLDDTVFHQPRPFTRQDLKTAIFSLSQPKPETLDLARQLAGSGKYRMATINNESRELNQYRIEHFGLREIFSLFISSCFVGKRKPEEGIYRLALDLTQKPAQECCFIDDREENLAAPAKLGIHTIRMQGREQLRQQLVSLGVAEI